MSIRDAILNANRTSETGVGILTSEESSSEESAPFTISDDVSSGEITQEVARKLMVKLFNMLNADGLTVMDLKDISAMLKDTSTYILKAGGNSSSDDKLDAFLSRLKA